MRIEIIANGKTGYVEDCGIGRDWWTKGEDFEHCYLHHQLRAIAGVLEEFGESEIADYIKEQEEKVCTNFFHDSCFLHEENGWTIGDAETAFNKWCKEHRTISLSDFKRYRDEDEYYEDEADKMMFDSICSEIDELIGWRSSVYGMDRQHMRVGLDCRWGQIEPQWVMIFRNPSFIGYRLDLDKIKDKIRTDILKRDEYYLKLKELQDEYGIYE